MLEHPETHRGLYAQRNREQKDVPRGCLPSTLLPGRFRLAQAGHKAGEKREEDADPRPSRSRGSHFWRPHAGGIAVCSSRATIRNHDQETPRLEGGDSPGA